MTGRNARVNQCQNPAGWQGRLVLRTEGKVYGIDHSPESVAMAIRTNKQWIDIARVEIREASVSRLPFSDGAFDVFTAVETYFWWPALPADMREVLRSPEARW
jgi:ubiquinone/menaquinone biosynthesis C-methylase UbiE